MCFIGDDDVVMPFIVEIVQWMKRNNCLIVKGVKPEYSWPGMPTSSTSGEKNGVLVDKKYSYTSEKILTKEALKYTLSKGGTSMKKMPCLYHGIVALKVLKKIFNTTGSYFPGPSPDMANAVALTLVENQYTSVKIPIVISGKSNSSIGGQGVRHNHVNHIDNVPHLPKETSKKWSSIIPKYWTGPTIWAESVLKSLEAFKSERKININYLLATIYIFHVKHRKQIFKGYNWSVFSWRKFLLAYIDQFLIRTRFFLKNRVYSNNEIVKENVTDIDKAVELIMASLDKDKMMKLYGVNPK